MERKKRDKEIEKEQEARGSEKKKGKWIVLMHFKTFVLPSSNERTRLMNEQAVRARAQALMRI